MATPMPDTATTTARGALMLRLTQPTSSTPMLDMLLMLMLLSSAPLCPLLPARFYPSCHPRHLPSTSVRLMPMLRPDTTVDTTATTPTATDTPTTDTDTVPMATTLMPTTTESRSAIIKLYTKVFFKNAM